MRDSITHWAEAGDPNAAIQLAEIYLSEGKIDDAKKFFGQAAEKNYRPAAKKLAEIFHKEGNLPEAINFYKKAVEGGDVEAMEKLVDLCSDDGKILNFVLEIIDEKYNKIYVSSDFFAQMMNFGSSRLSEFLPEQEKAIERRRIKNKILKLKANM